MKRQSSPALLVILILIGFALRLYRIDAVAFRGDEAFSAQYWAGEPLATTFSRIATLEPHPPLTYILFRLWGVLVGVQSEFAARLLDVLSNTIGIAAMYALGKRFSGDGRVGLLAALLWALHPFQIWHAQDFRNYAIWAGLSVITLWSGLRVIQRRTTADWGVYMLFATLTGYIFYMELMTIGVIGLYVLLTQWRDRRFIVRWLMVNVAIILLIFAAFFFTQGNLIGSGAYGGTTDSFELSQYGYRFLPVLNFGDTLSLEFRQKLWPVLLVVFIFAWGIIFSKQRQQALFLALLALVPLGMIGLISTRMNIFRPRYIMLSSPAYTLLLTGAFFISYERAKSSTRQRFILFLLTGILIGWLGITFVSLRNYYTNPIYQKAPYWPALTEYLHEQTQVGEVVIQTAVDSAYGFYYDAPAADFALPRSPDEPVSEIVANLEDWRDEYDSVWVVARTLEWPNAGVVEDWVTNNMQLVRDTSATGLPIRQYKRWQVDESEITGAILTTYGAAIELVGVRILSQEPTGEIPIWLYWQPQVTTDEALTVFVQLIGDINPATGSPLWAQDDHPPQHGRVSTDLWETGTIYRDVYELPMDAVTAGTYEVWVGFYNPDTGERLLTDSGADLYSIGTITVK